VTTPWLHRTENVAPLSVIVPTFQPGPHLMETLASIARQTVTPSELVVVDDGSDPPIALPSNFPSIRLLRIGHAGIAGARNAGVRATTAPLVHICDHDDVLEPTFVERVAVAFRTQPSVDVLHSVCGFIDENGALLPGRLPYRPPPSGSDRFLSALLSENYIGSVAAVFRRDAFNRVGGFRPLDYVQDWDFWLRLASTGSQFGHIPEILAWHRVHPNQQSRESERVSILEESLDMVGALRLPVRMWLARRRALAMLHLQASQVLHARGEPRALRHLISGWSRRPFKTSGVALRSLNRGRGDPR
jgi:GT2 family glycosyltransferase